MPEPGTLTDAVGVVPAVLLVLAAAVTSGYVVAVIDAAVLSGRATAAVTAPARATARLLVKQRRTTRRPDRLLWRTGSAAVLVLALLAFAVVPLPSRTLLSSSGDLVWFNAMEALLWAALWLVGWGANSVHALVGGYRFLAQGLAYELPLMFALITAGLAAGSLRTSDVVAAQHDLWFVVTMPVAFIIFVTSAAAFAFWGPFAAPAGTDIAGGILVELGGVDRLVTLAGRAVFLGSASAFGVALFLGGQAGPWLPGWLWFVGKTVLVIATLVVCGRRVPVIRPDRYVEVAWVVLVPLTLVQALAIALLVLGGFYT